MHENKNIFIAAALMLDEQGRCLLVRKRNTPWFMQPGGKIDAGETPQQALIRELYEELQVQIEPQDLTPLGSFSNSAANEPGHQVVAEMFAIRGSYQVTPAAEIEEIIWYNPADPQAIALAPLTEQQVLPLLAAQPH